MLEAIIILLKGLGTNIFITAIAAIIPLFLGIILSFVASKNKIIANVFDWLSLPFEILSPALILVFLFYAPGYLLDIPVRNRELIAIVGLMVCFIGHMPSKYDFNSSFLKNTICNGLDLLSRLFKWSFVTHIIAVSELSYSTMLLVSRHYAFFPIIIALLLATVVLAIPEIAKRIFRQVLK